MAISKKDIEPIAMLARIKLSDKEKEKYSEEFKAILGYIDKLKKVNTEGIEPVSHITGLENVVRKDEPIKKPLAEQTVRTKELVQMAPEQKDNYVKVPAVFKDN